MNLKIDDDLWNEYLNINEYCMSDYDKVIKKMIESFKFKYMYD